MGQINWQIEWDTNSKWRGKWGRSRMRGRWSEMGGAIRRRTWELSDREMGGGEVGRGTEKLDWIEIRKETEDQKRGWRKDLFSVDPKGNQVSVIRLNVTVRQSSCHTKQKKIIFWCSFSYFSDSDVWRCWCGSWIIQLIVVKSFTLGYFSFLSFPLFLDCFIPFGVMVYRVTTSSLLRYNLPLDRRCPGTSYYYQNTSQVLYCTPELEPRALCLLAQSPIG